MKITLQLFGAFKEFGENLELILADNAMVSDIRMALNQKLSEHNKDSLITSFRFATETEILSEDTALKDGATITIIPPVAGG